MHLRETLLESGNQVEKVLEWQIGMQTTDNVKLGDRFAIAGSCGLESFLESHGVRSRHVFFSPESAKTAGGHTNIGGVDMAIDVEVRPIAMHSLPNRIRQPSDSKDVATAIERECVIRIEA